MAKNVLDVTTVAHSEEILRSHIGEADTVKVVVPVVRQGFLDWLANDEKAFGQAERVAAKTARELPGNTAEAVATFPADEIVVAVRPDEQEGFVESVATDNAPQQSVEGVPVRYVVIRD